MPTPAYTLGPRQPLGGVMVQVPVEEQHAPRMVVDWQNVVELQVVPEV